MSLSKVNWFAFLPQLLSIYLILLSPLIGGYLKAQVTRAVQRKVLTLHEDFVLSLASGWGALLGFMGAIFAALFSAMSIWSATRSFGGVVVTIVVLIAAFIPLMWYLFSQDLDQLKAMTIGPRMRITPATLCRLVLLAVNLGLIVAVAISQQL